MRPVRVLIVDDSAVMRGLIARVLARDPEIVVVGEAGDPYQARQAIKELNPDVMTLDVEMPRMNGVEFLEKVMRLRPFPVVMVSTLTEQGAAITIRALELGAVDYISKPTPEHPDTLEELPAKLKAAAGVKEFADSRPVSTVATTSEASYRWDGKIVAIGASTGGVEALIAVLSSYPKACPPTVIAIHMPAQFTKSFAQRLDRLIAPDVAEAMDGASLEPGRVYIAPGTASHLEVAKLDKLRCRLTHAAPVNGHRPSVDPLFHSVSVSCGPNALGVILTGMGRDGADGLLAMRRAGARTIGQNKATCVVYGMPRVAFEIGAVEIQSALGDIGADILTLTSGIRGRK